MTKSLTEQWREGTLPKGWYYVKTHCEEIKKLYCGDGESLELDDPETSAYYFYHRKHDKGQVEVLAPVPSYDEDKKLQEQLKETKQELQIRINDNADMYAKLCNALMQLEEANAIIKDMRPFIQGSMKRETFARILNYEEKWGVKCQC